MSLSLDFSPKFRPEFLTMGALEMARRISDDAITSVALVESHIEFIEKTHSALNALTTRRFGKALAEAEAADQLDSDARRHRPLHGVPISVKDCFAVEGLPTTLGIRPSQGPNVVPATRDARVVQLLKDAGAILVGKTNVPQLMLINECDNPYAGRTVNPWDKRRTCGGSSGGSAALLAVGGVALELGSDAGGSARVPAHFCGTHSMIPTPGVISRAGMTDGVPGMAHLTPVPSPMARRVEDLIVAGNVLAEPAGHRFDWLRIPSPEAVKRLRIACWPTSDAFPVSPAIARAVEFAKTALADRGATFVDLVPPPLVEMSRYFAALWLADGGNTVRRQVAGRSVDPQVKQMIRTGRMPAIARAIYEWTLRRRGDLDTAEIVKVSHGRSVAGYWQLVAKLKRLRESYLRSWAEAKVDAVICPPFGLPAIFHGQALELFLPACYAVWVNLFGLPAGVLSVTHVRSDEEDWRDASTPTSKLAAEVERQSAGLPVGVQVIARPHGEQAIVEIMLAVEAVIPVEDNPSLNVPPLVRSVM